MDNPVLSQRQRRSPKIARECLLHRVDDLRGRRLLQPEPWIGEEDYAGGALRMTRSRICPLIPPAGRLAASSRSGKTAPQAWQDGRIGFARRGEVVWRSSHSSGWRAPNWNGLKQYDRPEVSPL